VTWKDTPAPPPPPPPTPSPPYPLLMISYLAFLSKMIVPRIVMPTWTMNTKMFSILWPPFCVLQFACMRLPPHERLSTMVLPSVQRSRGWSWRGVPPRPGRVRAGACLRRGLALRVLPARRPSASVPAFPVMCQPSGCRLCCTRCKWQKKKKKNYTVTEK
jgi:hypothetical protein